MKPLVTVTIEITETEFMAIALVGSEEMRTVKQQIRYLVAQDMIRRGLLKVEDLHQYAETEPTETAMELVNRLAAEWDRKEDQILAEETASEIEDGEVVEKKSPPFDLPPRYRGGKETLYWKVFNLFAQHPAQFFTRADVVEGLQVEERQVSSPMQRLLARNLVEVVGTTTNEEGKEFSVYRLTEAASQLVKERNKGLYG